MRKFSFLLLCFKILFVLLLCSHTNVFAQVAGSAIFKDDFNRSTLGNAWQTDTWSIVKGAAYTVHNGPLRTATAYKDSSYIIETSAKGFTNSYHREFRIIFGQANLNNDSAYVIRYSQEYGGTLTLGRATDNVFHPQMLDQVAIYPDYNATDWYKFKIARYKSGLIQVYVNKGAGYGAIPLLEAIDSAYASIGHFGWREDTQTASEDFFVDFIHAYRPTTEKRAVKEKPAEDNLITQVSAKSGKKYIVSKLATGVKEFTDRDYTITSLPPYLKDASFIQTAMDDKYNTKSDFLTSFIKKEAIVYIGYDPRATVIPDWLNMWTKTGDIIGTTDPGSPYLEVYSRLLQFWEIYPRPLILGGNSASPAKGAKMNYLVAAVERPAINLLQAEQALLSGAVVAKNHPGYSGTGFADFINASNDFIEWTVNINVPGTYNLGFTFANGGTADRPLQISHNGTNIKLVSFSPTGAWNSWSTTNVYGGVFFTNGIHKIRATVTGASGPNIDLLSLYFSSPHTDVAANRVATNQIINKEVFYNSPRVYPNPFTEKTDIYFSLKENANVLLSVYSLQGQQLQSLVNGVREKGNYRVTFDAHKLATGIYFYRLQTGKEVRTGKLLKR